ncbi:MAG TPA: hypothetical protein VFU36_12195 [Jatrophihabitans sp.]|nr:hypothetical protein [Jatrophihabitans sp.]
MKTVVAILFMLLTSLATPWDAQAETSESCGDNSGATLVGIHVPGAVGVSGECAVRSTDLPGPGGLPVLVIDCGYATATDDHTFWNKACGPTGFPCPAIAGNPAPHQFLTTTSLTTTDPTGARIAQWCAGLNTPLPSAAALRAEIIRLLHPPAIGVSPGTGTGLVNLKTLYWITTPTTVNLGHAALIGLPVQLQVNYDHTDFDFGDHTTGQLPTPGTPYNPARDCGQCSDRFGHTYTHPGPITITAHTYWHAAYRITGQPWTPIPGTLTATQPATTTLTIHQARSILISR